MKNLLKKRLFAAIILIITALLSVPLLGGLKLKIEYEARLNDIDAIAISADKHGNSLTTDMELGIQAARNLLSVSASVLGSENSTVRDLETAFSAYTNAENTAVKYQAYLDINARCELVYQTAYAKTIDTEYNTIIDTQYQEVLSRAEIIKRAYSSELMEAIDEANALISGFPAKALAKLYNIGETE